MEGLTASTERAKIRMVCDIGCNSSIKSPSDSGLYGDAYHGNADPDRGMPKEAEGSRCKAFRPDMEQDIRLKVGRPGFKSPRALSKF